MDSHFLEFWGNLLINAARGQKQLEDMTKWMTQGLRGFEDLTAMFRKSYGLDRVSEGTADYEKTWNKAVKDFQASFEDYLKLFGVIPLQEHLDLVRKYETLKEKVTEQEETIKHLRMLLDEKSGTLGNMVRGYEDLYHELIRKQADHFKKLMTDLGRPFEGE
jgi:hypothetical protein